MLKIILIISNTLIFFLIRKKYFLEKIKKINFDKTKKNK